jgi:ABC-type nitrate/sulfonate/bicarbonate transport system permease component
MRGILILMVVVMLLNFVLDGLEVRILRWRPKEHVSSSD